MKLSKWMMDDREGRWGIMMQMTQEEALRTISSISSQLASNSVDAGMEEFFTEDGSYLSIVVTPRPVPDPGTAMLELRRLYHASTMVLDLNTLRLKDKAVLLKNILETARIAVPSLEKGKEDADAQGISGGERRDDDPGEGGDESEHGSRRDAEGLLQLEMHFPDW